MTPKRRVPLGKKARRAALDESQTRAVAKAAKRGKARERAAYNERLVEGIDHRALDAAMARVLAEQDEAAAAPRRRARGGARAFPAGAAGRWVPIGPSVVRRGQAMDRPRVGGRVRDIAVDGTGTRAYAATAMGGVWYTGDGGATWSPVGGWAERSRVVGGSSSAQAIGCLLVVFDTTPGHDFVMVGTGEPSPRERPVGSGAMGGAGVLVADRVVAAADTGDPWEADSGIAGLEGLGVFRLVRQPGRVAGAVGANADTVVACTTNGAWVGVRSALPPSGALPARNGFTWTQMATLTAKYPNVAVCDAVWLSGGRLVLALADTGLVYTDDVGATTPVDVVASQPPAVQIDGNMSLAVATGNRLYLLGETGGAPTLWQVPDATIAAPAVNACGGAGLPAGLWPGQRDYDQAIAVDVVGGTDRVYVGGSTVMPRPSTEFGASLWCFDVVGGNLSATPTIGGTGVPPAGAGADVAGLIGNNVHADVHAIRLTGPAAPRRQVWVGCDGGVFVSDRSGRVQSFVSANTGMAALQPTFVRNHPVNGHMVGAGMQDNGTLVRTGDTVWDELYKGDGGGVAFAPTAPHIFVRQYVRATWYGPAASFVDPMTRSAGQPLFVIGGEDGASTFYSGAATVDVPAVGPTPRHTRLALGTNRVWITDDLGLVAANTWRALPHPNGVATNGRPGLHGAATAGQLAFGVPAPSMGQVVTLAWASPTELLVVFVGGIVRYTETSPGTWTTKTWRLTSHQVAMPRTTILTDVCPVPGVRNFYVASTGVVGSPEETLWFYSPSDDQFHRTNLRHQLDIAGPPIVVGPRDPVFSVVLDPADQNIVFAGTATGVWRGHRTSNLGVHDWATYVDGLPQAAVQDLHCWVDPLAATPYTATTPRVLRAGLQSRGVWEVDLAADARRSTWIRSHATDDRRMPLAANLDALQAPPVLAPIFTASPDIVVRPQRPQPPTTPTPTLLGGVPITSLAAPTYPVWTFQTAFRWLYPSVVANGVFSDAFGNLVALHRTTMAPPKTAVPTIDGDVWNDVVGGLHVKADGTVTTAAADPFAVYRAPWHTSRAPSAAPTEADLTELVVPPRDVNGIWDAYTEPSTVDVLLHHRDGREVPANGAFVVLAWQSGAAAADLMALSPATLLTYLTSFLPGPAGAIPAGWTFATQQLGVPLEGRLPRGVSFDVNLKTAGPFVLFVAFVASNLDDLPLPVPTTSAAATVLPTTITDLVRCWPNAAARVVRMQPRPA